VEDEEVDIVYVATPHSHHYQHARLALEAGKHVLVEKPITVNAEQCKELRRVARERGRFCMEAVWTRFFPLSLEVVRLVREGSLGDVKRVYADFGVWNDVGVDFGETHRKSSSHVGWRGERGGKAKRNGLG
jgi:predicted dehydrogenase